MIRAELVEEGRRLVSAPLDSKRRWELGDLAVTMVNEALNGANLDKRRRGTQATFILQDFCDQLPDHEYPEHKLRLQVLRGCYEQSMKLPPDIRDPSRSFSAHKPLRADHLNDDLRRQFFERGILHDDSTPEDESPKVMAAVAKLEKLAEIPGAFDAWVRQAKTKARRSTLKQLRQEITETRRELERMEKAAADPDRSRARQAHIQRELLSTRLTLKMAEREVLISNPSWSTRGEMAEAITQTAHALIDLDQVLRGQDPTSSSPPPEDKKSGPAGELPAALS